MEIVKTYPYRNAREEFPDRKLILARRSDGRYSIGEDYFHHVVDEDCTVLVDEWACMAPPGGIFDSQASAEQEVLGRIAQVR